MLINNSKLESLKIQIYADLAEPDQIDYWQQIPFIRGFTTNPGILRKAGISDYEQFARHIVDKIPHLPISFEVLADDFSGMIAQAKRIISWGESVYVKIPVVNCVGESTLPVIRTLSDEGIALNVTALMTDRQVMDLIPELDSNANLIFSVFCGRVADTGLDPVPMMSELAKQLSAYKNMQLLWASSREVLNIFQAEDAGCDIITLSSPLLTKLDLLDKDLSEYSLETVREFYRDGKQISFEL